MSSADSHTELFRSESTSRTKKQWSLTQEAFEKLLNSLSPDRDEAGAQYEMFRRRLVRFFEWRAIDSPDDYADETINRVARRIAEGQIIGNIKSYFYGVARMVFMEAKKDHDRALIPLDDATPDLEPKVPEDAEEVRFMCFDHCLDSLPPESRRLIIDYYQEEKRAKIQLRQELADRLQIPLNALRIRAHRIRLTLEQCITQCIDAQ